MFRKQQKKIFPPGTFIPTPARVMAIVQLCLAFTVILWNASQPFMGELFDLKSKQLLVYDVMGIPSEHLSGSLAEIAKTKKDRLERNAMRFQALPATRQQEIAKLSNQWQQELQRTFLDKLQRSFHVLAFDIPPFEQAWLLLSLAVPILLLKRIEGAKYVVWLLPLTTLLYAVDNRWHAVSAISAEAQLFPTEQTLIQQYIKEPLDKDVFGQKSQLMQGWKRYLVIEWGKETPVKEPKLFEGQAEKGEFVFNLARLDAKKADRGGDAISKNRRPPQNPESLSVLAIYLFWNLSLALTAWRASSGSQ
jgi:hypothetical protein